MCPDQNYIGISTVAVQQVLLQKGDLEKANGLTGELFPFTDDVSRGTHIQFWFTLWLRHCAGSGQLVVGTSIHDTTP